jgi:hypothetical protein
MRRLTISEFHAEIRAQGVSSREHVAFRCVMCGTIQSGRDFIRAGAGASFAEVERFLGFSCIGRFTDAGPPLRPAKANAGCDWTLGGLFRIHRLVVIDERGVEHPRFELASPDEAQAHERLAFQLD